MIKLNNKGMTSIEILICFIIVAAITVSLFDVVSTYKTKQQVESNKSIVLKYKNSLTKIINDDVIKYKLSSISNLSQDSDEEKTTYSVTLYFEKNMLTGGGCRGNYQAIGCNKILQITKYSKSSDTLNSKVDNIVYPEIVNGSVRNSTYTLPDVGGGFVEDSDDIVKDIRFSDIRIENVIDNAVLDITIFHHELSNYYHIQVIAPTNYYDGDETEETDPPDTPDDNLAGDKVFNPDNLGGEGGIDNSDSEQTFITGVNPNNFVWYSGNLWRVVGKNKADNSIKIIADRSVYLSYSKNSQYTYFGDSHAKAWLNDTSVDGFLGNLRNYSSFIKMDSKWAPVQNNYGKVTAAVGLLTYDEVQKVKGWVIKKYDESSRWWVLTAATNGDSGSTLLYAGSQEGYGSDTTDAYGIRPVINLKSNIVIASGKGTETDPYRLVGDNDTPASGTLLNTRYSGEYVRFGTGTNNLYRIVSKELGGAKIVSDKVLYENGTTNIISKLFVKTTYSSIDYNPQNSNYEVAYWLNNDFLNPANGYLTSSQVSMIDNGTWYFGTVDLGQSLSVNAEKVNYRLAKYTTPTGTTLVSNQISAKVGLLRYGELLSGHYVLDPVEYHWLLTRLAHLPNYIHINANGYQRPYYDTPTGPGANIGMRPAMHLKKTVKITGGNGTKANPFTISN